jgi:hypothetical protein
MNRQQNVDKHAKIAMAIITGIIIFLFIIAITGCKHNPSIELETLPYTQQDSVMDEVWDQGFCGGDSINE